MKIALKNRIITFVLLCALITTIPLASVVKVSSAENILYQSTFDNNNGLTFLKGSWSLSSGDLIPVYNQENRLILEGTNKSDYVITLNATFLSGSAGQSGYGIYFRANNSADISGYCFQYDNGIGKKFITRKVTAGKEGTAENVVAMSSVMGSSFDITAPHTVVITVIGNHFIIKVDNVEVINFTDNTFTQGYVGLRSWSSSYNKFHDIKVVDASPTPSTTPEPIPSKNPVIIEFSYAYLYGYIHGNVGADDPVTREDASALIYRLLKQNDKLDGFVKPSSESYSDVAKSRWSFSAVEYMRSIEVFDQNSSVIYPANKISRGEAARIVAYSMGLQPDSDKTIDFSDLAVSNKNYSSIKALVDAGLLIGYPNNEIKPSATITRAEYVTIINRLIGRDNRYDVSAVDSLYPDITPAHWAYTDILRASLGFSKNSSGDYVIDPKMKLQRSALDYN